MCNLLAWRLLLLYPDAFLAARLPLTRPLFTSAGLIGWIALVTTGIAMGAMNIGALTGNLDDQLLTTQNVALMLLAYPLVKAFHELGHAYATKVWGGEIHEIGVMLLIFVPVPYVDASASAAFRNKWTRATVRPARTMVEAGLASIALLVWIAAEPGLVRAFAFNVIL